MKFEPTREEKVAEGIAEAIFSSGIQPTKSLSVSDRCGSSRRGTRPSRLFVRQRWLFCGFLFFLLPSTAQAVDFSTHGYYRARVVTNQNIDLQTRNRSITNSNNRIGILAYNQMRLRLEPNLKVNDWLAVHGIFDVLDNVLFGTSERRQLTIHQPVVGTLTLPAGAGSFYQVGGNAGENGSLNVRAAWGEILSPIGLFKIGRQPSHWGLGIFQHDGRDRDSDFGDMVDRILYISQFELTQGAMSAGLLWDIPFEIKEDPRISGFNDTILNNGRDTNQYALFLLYDADDAAFGVFGGYRRRNGAEGGTTTTVTAPAGGGTTTTLESGLDGDTNLFFGDMYGRYEVKNYRFQLEGIFLGGKVTTGVAADGINFQGIQPASAANPCGTGGIICMPAEQPIRVVMAAFEGDAKYDFGGELNLKSGFAQGDGNILSSRITQLGFRPDYKIALLMFNIPLGTSPAFFDSTLGEQLAGGVPITGNYVNNTLYVSTGYKHRFDIAARWGEWWKIGGQVVTAWAHKRNVDIDFSALTGTANLPRLTETTSSMWKRWYGVEVDLSFEAKLFEHLLTTLEVGGLLPGRAYDIEVQLFNPASIINPIPTDKAEFAWIARVTSTIEF